MVAPSSADLTLMLLNLKKKLQSFSFLSEIQNQLATSPTAAPHSEMQEIEKMVGVMMDGLAAANME